MKYVDEYRERDSALRVATAIAKQATRRWVLMEVCGGQTHSIVRYGVDELLGDSVELLHGPGCPVCVTPLSVIDRAHEIALKPGVTLCAYGDMLRVPGSHGDLFAARAHGADVRIVYSPLDAVRIAERLPEREVVFLAVGFETTAPANAMAVKLAAQKRLRNISFLVSHVLVPPALGSILETPHCRVQAFLGPGHVCTVMGTHDYEAIVARYCVPIIVTGFEPLDLLEGILRCVKQLEQGQARLEVQYGRAVREQGNPAAIESIAEVFEIADHTWRGIGEIPSSGHRLRPAFAHMDATTRFDVSVGSALDSGVCRAGDVLRGLLRPTECPAFGNDCTPDTPLGATMVSSEGACAAYFQHGRRRPGSLPLVNHVGADR